MQMVDSTRFRRRAIPPVFGVKHTGALKVRDFDLELKDVGDDGTFNGYGSVFGVVDSYQEVVKKGAFRDSLRDLKAKGRPVPVLWQHQSSAPIGAWTDLKEDDRGLFGAGELLINEVGQAKEAHALMKRRVVTGLSIGYWVRESSFDEVTGIRTLTKLDLVEISLVTFPANDDARVEAVKFKLAHGEMPTDREFEKFLREAAGFSKTQAAGLVCHGLAELRRRESAREETMPGREALRKTLAGFTLPQL